MLKKMVIKNFKCFKNETVFDFRRTNYKLLEQNTCGKILKGALFVGDNASGKTTAIQPIRLLLELLFGEKDIQFYLYHCLFSEEEKTSLEYEFEIDGHTINYFFSFGKDAFIEERLIVDGKEVITRLAGNAILKEETRSAVYKIHRSILFLKQLYFNTRFYENEVLIKWFNFLKKSIYVDAYEKKTITYNGENILPAKFIQKYGTEEINHFFENNNFDYFIQYEKAEEETIPYGTIKDREGTIFFKRKGIVVPIPSFVESLGNQLLLYILPAVLLAVQDGGMLIIDEFSSGLHNKLEELLVKYIMKNGKNTQLFFVSHSTNLLSNSILRPDQIYAVEMFGDEGSKLSRFSDEQPRVAQNLEKMYLSGVFGGIPEYETKEG